MKVGLLIAWAILAFFVIGVVVHLSLAISGAFNQPARPMIEMPLPKTQDEMQTPPDINPWPVTVPHDVKG